MTTPRPFRVGGALLVASLAGGLALAQVGPRPIQPPPDLDKTHFIYHGVNVGNVNAASKSGAGKKSALEQAVEAYLAAVQRPTVAWVNFAHELSDPDPKAITFPAADCQAVWRYGAVPFITLVTPGPCDFLDGAKAEKGGWKLSEAWAKAIGQWGQGARDYLIKARPRQRALILCWGAGSNGEPSCWKKYPDKFKDAYRAVQRAIVTAVDGNDKPATLSTNIRWVFQIDVPDGSVKKTEPARFEDFYPADPEAKEPALVDWIGVTVFGGDGTLTPLAVQLGPYYQRIRDLAPDKPIIVAAFGCPDTFDIGSVCWTRDALEALIHETRRHPKVTGEFPRVIGFAWFNSSSPLPYCVTDGKPAADPRGGSLRLETNSIVAGVFREQIAAPRVFSWPALFDPAKAKGK